AAGRSPVFVDYLILRSPRQERDKVPRVFEFRRCAPHPAEEAPPHALQEVERIEPRPEQPRQLSPHDQPDLGFEPAQQLARRTVITRLDPLEEFRQLALASLRLRWLAEGHQPASSLRSGRHPAQGPPCRPPRSAAGISTPSLT